MLHKRSNDITLVMMPQCEPCGALHRPAPVRVDTEELRLTFVVHRDFEKRVSGKVEPC